MVVTHAHFSSPAHGEMPTLKRWTNYLAMDYDSARAGVPKGREANPFGRNPWLFLPLE
jgi:hypothetical protein